MEFPSESETRSSAEMPYLSAAQASALLRSGLAISKELIDTAFDPLVAVVNESLAGRWDFDAGAPLVQRLLGNRADDFRRAFLMRMDEAQDTVQTQLSAEAPQHDGALDAELLTLLDSTSVESVTVIERWAGKVGGHAEQPLRDLNLIVAHLAGRPLVRDADNPLGPVVYVRALLGAAADCDLPDDVHEFMLASFQKPLGEELARLFRALVDHYTKHGIDPRVIRRALAHQRAAAGQGGWGADGGPSTITGPATVSGPQTRTGPSTMMGGPSTSLRGPGGRNTQMGWSNAPDFGGADGFSGYAAGIGSEAGRPAARPQAGARRADPPVLGNEPQAVLGSLMTRLQSNARGTRLPPLPAQGPPSEALMESIDDLQRLGMEGVGNTAFAGTPAGSINAWREQLTAQSTRTVDKLTIELVGMLFDHVLRDSQVPVEIKARLSRLQFPVLKAALLDAAFFASSAHPARRLIDRIAGTAVGWEPYGDDNERFLGEVERVVTEVLAHFETDVAVFERLYGEFDKFVSDVHPGENDPVSRAKKALEAAEKQEILTINTTIQVRRAFDRLELEPYLKDFLLGAWVKVLVVATVRNEATPGFSRAFRDVIHDLVWSVQPKATAEERTRLVKMIPGMVRVLRDGLTLIEIPEREKELFFGRLMESHAMAVKPVDQAAYIRSTLLTSELRARIDGMQLSGIFPVTTVPGGIKVPTAAILRAAAEHHADLQMPDPLTDLARLDAVEDARVQEEIGRWQRGTWFRLWNGTEFVRARLRWMSPLRTLFLFASEHEGKAHVLSSDMLKSYVARKYVEPLETTALTKRAVDAVVSDFEAEPARASTLISRYAAAT